MMELKILGDSGDSRIDEATRRILHLGARRCGPTPQL